MFSYFCMCCLLLSFMLPKEFVLSENNMVYVNVCDTLLLHFIEFLIRCSFTFFKILF